ncbi:glycosyl hydrolase [Reichenbachiella ulvae]|uniref:Glycosyl hydrolase n=1 Tax=Reichenbachiella ulvae TaxID=2980104 RepID=A0ABT3CUH1_9BACT|nr:glycosyl hydrolase [Reichenbachiella ulvae]MCV9387350.1 glycosyl hydrolase [Reichenbachiella ulvae]
MTRLQHIILFVLLLLASCTEREKPLAIDWPEVTAETKPWTRWWWHGSAVTKEGITSELESFKEVGFGGVEITPIFGVKGQEDQFIDFLSEEWVDMLVHTLEEAERLGLGVDMATGTGWPFGGPWIGENEAPRNVLHKTYVLKSGQSLKEKIQYIQQPMVRAVGDPVGIDQIKFPIAANDNLQELALDQVKFEKELPLICLMAYDQAGNTLNLTDRVKNGKLDWTAPDGEWQLYALFMGWHGKMVERAAPAGEGNVIDHFSKSAIQVYFSKFDSAFKDCDLGTLRAFFNDSYEVDDARGQADWTPEMFDAFQQLNGYDLRGYLPELLGQREGETSKRVLMDYRATVEQLISENFTNEWKSWSRQYDAIIRNQAHGSPANILDLYAQVDIPETEGTEILKIKFASSAANVNGKRLSSSESATWLNDHFQSSLADIRKNLERYLLGGVNHVFYHGTAYSPDDEVWPGWLFYAAIHANDRNTWWDDFSKLNEYIARIQSFMQNSQPDNDVLVYFPVYDRYAERGHGLLEHFDIRGNFYKSQVKLLGDTLLEKGVAFDLISDKQIANLKVDANQIVSQGNAYQAILIPKTTYIPVATMRKLLESANAGVKVLFHGDMPKDVPGLNDLEKRQQELLSLKEKMGATAAVASSLEELLTVVQLPVESMTQLGLQFNRKKYEGNTLYLIANWGEERIDQWVPMAKGAAHAYLFDPMTGEKGIAQTNGQSVYLQLAPGESCLVVCAETPFEGNSFSYYTEGETQKIKGEWEVVFTKGGPDLPESRTLSSLSSWTKFEDVKASRFSGTATYTTTFEKPAEKAAAYQIRLGKVHESAQVYLNGAYLETLIGPVYELTIPSEKLKETNELKVLVSNLMANRIKHMDESGQTYQRFYNINFPAHDAENRGEDKLFHADHWEAQPSGLLGPVELVELEEKTFN